MKIKIMHLNSEFDLRRKNNLTEGGETESLGVVFVM